MKLPPVLGHSIALLVGAVVFFGGMAIVAVFVAEPLKEWIGVQTKGWPAWATLGSAVAIIAVAYTLGFAMLRRDQRIDAERAEATRFANGDAVDPRS